jgi:hypothetical protein
MIYMVRHANEQRQCDQAALVDVAIVVSTSPNYSYTGLDGAGGGMRRQLLELSEVAI